MSKKRVNKKSSISARANILQNTDGNTVKESGAKAVEKQTIPGNNGRMKRLNKEEKPEPLKGGKKFFNRMDKLGDLFFLNLRVALCCIPIVTIGAAFTAMYAVTNKMVEDKEGNVGKEYWKAFKSNFHESTIAWLINLVYILLMYAQFRYISTNTTQGANLLMIVLGFEVILLCFELPLLFPMIARYENKPLNHIINSIVFSIANFGTWFRTFFMWAVPVVLYYLRPNLLVYTWYLWILFLTAFFAYICSMFLTKFYAKLEGSGAADTEKYRKINASSDEGSDETDKEQETKAVVSAAEGTGDRADKTAGKESADSEEVEPYSKAKYFRDYYLKYIILGIIVIILGVYIVKDVANGSKNILAEGTAINAHFTENELAELKDGLFKKLEGDTEKDDIVFVDEYSMVFNGTDMDQISVNQATTELFNYINTNTLDYIILDEEALKNLNEYDAFMNLEYILTDEQMEQLKSDIIYLPVGINLSGNDIDEYKTNEVNETNETPNDVSLDNHVLPIAIDISNSDIFDTKRDTRMFLVFASATPKTQNMQDLIDYIYSR